MPEKTFNINISKVESIPTPLSIKQEMPIGSEACEVVMKSRQELIDILDGKDNRLIAIVGPCSVHDTKAAIDYAERLSKLAEEVKDQICIVMRVYFEKPRTTIGWKGMINDPHLNGTYDISTGLKRARKLLLDVVNLGLPTATETLDPVTPQYLSDLITWSAVGARTTESQTHREMASGLSMPLGFKNGTNGDLMVAVNAITSATHPQSFLGVNQVEGKVSVFHTMGNKYCHLVLRGGSDGPNYSEEHIKDATQKLEDAGIKPAIMVDCSHANSNKDHNNQPKVLEELVRQKKSGAAIIGFMLESNIGAGNQPINTDPSELEYGVSITDKCIDWATTEKVLKDAANQLKN